MNNKLQANSTRSSLVGFRFLPSDQEIINYFLNHKMNGRNSLVDHVIGEINLLQCHPQDIPAMSKISSHDGQFWYWYFFNRPDYKFSNSNRASRKTKRGFWKPTGKPRRIEVRGEEIGGKRTLVFYEEVCGLKPTKTNWIIHEYQPKTTLPHQNKFVLCKLKYKADEKSGEKWTTSVPNDSENLEIQSQVQLKDTLFDEPLLLTTCSNSQHVGLNLNDDDVAPITLADSFLDLDE